MRVSLLLALCRRTAKPDDQAALDTIMELEAQELADNWGWEVRAAAWGAGLVAAAFLARLGISLAGFFIHSVNG